MARGFNGSNQYMDVAGAPVTAVPLSMAFWFYATSTANDMIPLSLFYDTDNYILIQLNTSGGAASTVQAYTEAGGSSAHGDTTANWVANTWQHGAGVWAASNSRAGYLNGGNKGTNTTDLTPTAPNHVYIGNYDGANVWYTGYLAEIIIEGAAWSDAEVAALALGLDPFAIRPASVAAWWPLIRGSQDRAGGYHLTEYNSPTVQAHPPKIRPWWTRPTLIRAAIPALAGILGERGTLRGIFRGVGRGI